MELKTVAGKKLAFPGMYAVVTEGITVAVFASRTGAEVYAGKWKAFEIHELVPSQE